MLVLGEALVDAPQHFEHFRVRVEDEYHRQDVEDGEVDEVVDVLENGIPRRMTAEYQTDRGNEQEL